MLTALAGRCCTTGVAATPFVQHLPASIVSKQWVADLLIKWVACFLLILKTLFMSDYLVVLLGPQLMIPHLRV